MPRYMEILLAATCVVVIVGGIVAVTKDVNAGCINLGFYKSCGVSATAK